MNATGQPVSRLVAEGEGRRNQRDRRSKQRRRGGGRTEVVFVKGIILLEYKTD
jgi:hypothetical protein